MKFEPKWTKEPWTHDEAPGCKRIMGALPNRAFPEEGPEELACTSGLYDEDEDLANTRVMTQAPAMARKLHEEIEWLGWQMDEYKMVMPLSLLVGMRDRHDDLSAFLRGVVER